MSLQLPQDNPASDAEDRFLHLKRIVVDLAYARPNSDLKIKLKHESTFKHKSTAFRKTDCLHWECDVYIKFRAKAVLTVQKSSIVRRWSRVVAEVPLDFNSVQFADNMTVEFKDQASGVNIRLLFGRSQPTIEVTRLLADKAIIALATKVHMLDKLDQVLGYLDLVLKMGNHVAQLHPAAHAVVPIVNAAFKKFQEIAMCHHELVFIMNDVVSMLPVMRLALDRVTDIEVQGLLQTFVDIIKRISQDLIEFSSRPPAEFLLRNWLRSKKDDVDELKNQMMHSKLNMGLALEVDIKGGVLEIQESIAGNQKAINEIRQHWLSEVDEKALERLKPPEHSPYDPSCCCLPGTRAFLLQDIEQWLPSTDHPSRLYWVYGVAGCGKSSVAASVASILESRKLPFGSFFCKRDIPERRDPTRLIRALAYFLARASAPFSEALLLVLEKDSDIFDKPLSTQFRVLLADRLPEVSQSAPTSRITIVLDALDECDDNKTVSSFLIQMVTLAPWLRLIVTSRPLPDIQKELQSSEELTISCDLFSLSADDDILTFVRNQFGPKGSLAVLRSHVTDAQIEALGWKAEGLFIWIATVVSHISHRKGGKLRVLEQILDSATVVESEKKLDALYLQVLNSAAASEDLPANKDMIQTIIGLVFVTSRNRPLPANALYAFIPSELGVLPEELEAVLQDLGSVLTMDSRTNAVRVCHPSFLDFIGNQTRSGDFWTETAKLDAMMAERSFQIMISGLKFNICELESSYLPNGEVSDLKERIDQHISRELQYSCLYWMNHLSGSGLGVDHPFEEPIRQSLCDLLCQTRSLYWLEVLSLMSELKGSGTILQKLIDMHKHLENDGRLYSYIMDLYRFVRTFHEPMATSTPHIYISALLWTPSESLIAKSHCLKFDSRHCVLEGRNKYWPNNLQTLLLDSITNCVAYSPDGRYIISGSEDKTVRIWDAQTGAPVGEPLYGHEGAVNCVAYSPDGRHIVSGSYDKNIWIWNAQTGAPVSEPLKGHDNWIYSVAYSPDGCHIVSGSGDKTIRIWDAQTGALVGEPLRGHGAGVLSLAYSPDGHHIISGSGDRTIRIWDAQTGTPVGAPLHGHGNWVRSVIYSPDGRHIVSGSFDRSIRIWDAQTGASVGEPLLGHDKGITSIAYSPDGRHIVSGSGDKTVWIWNAQTGAPVGQPLHGHCAAVLSVAYSSDGHCIVSGSHDNTIRIWDAQTSGSTADELLHGHDSVVLSVSYSPDGHHIVSGSHDSTIRIWDARTGALIGGPLHGHYGAVNCVAYSPDGRHIVSGSGDKTVWIWDARTGVPAVEPLQGHDDWVYSVAFSPDGRHIVSGSGDNTVRIWDSRTGAQVGKPLKGHDDWVMSVAYSPDGRHIVSGSGDKTIRIWDAQTGAPFGEPLRGHGEEVTSIAYSPDGLRIVSGSGDTTIWIWDAQTGAPVGEPLQGHDNWVYSVVYSPDGHHIVSGSRDKTIRTWDAQTGAPVGEPLHGHAFPVSSVAYCPDGHRIISGSYDNTIRMWDAQVGAPAGALSLRDSCWYAYSADEECVLSSFVSRTMAEAPEIHPVVYSEIPRSIPMDGWIRTLNGGLLLWVPAEYRNGVCDMSLACMPHNAAGHRVKVEWKTLRHGSEWCAVKVDLAED